MKIIFFYKQYLLALTTFLFLEANVTLKKKVSAAAAAAIESVMRPKKILTMKPTLKPTMKPSIKQILIKI